MTQKTPLYPCHLEANAHMVDFAGWQMPLHYGSQMQEHHQVRQSCGMFDVSHMGVIDILGPGARNFLRYLLANDVDKLSEFGKALYSCMLNEQGGVIDDLIVYGRAADNYRLVVNAGTFAKDTAWIQTQAKKFSVNVHVRPELALIAVQGPLALEKVQAILPERLQEKVAALKPFTATELDGWFVGRTGYTGEQGVEMIVSPEQAVELWRALAEVDVPPCGLGARDTLRLEAGMNLYGQDMDEATSPLVANLAWTVALQDPERQFMGRSAIEKQKTAGVNEWLVGLMLEDRGVLRQGQTVIVPDVGEGVITSGGYSPTLECSIALARVPKGVGRACLVEVRGKQLRAKVGKPCFVRNGENVFEELVS